MIQTQYYWQWWSFPSGGPHDGEYEVLDIEKMRGVSAAAALALPYDNRDNIPEAAEDYALAAAIELAEGHNALLEYRDKPTLESFNEVIPHIDRAYGFLHKAFRAGWADGLIAAQGLENLVMQSVLVLQDSDLNLVTAFLNGGGVGVIAGTIGEYWANKDTEITVVPFNTQEELLEALRNGHVGAVLIDAFRADMITGLPFKVSGLINVLMGYILE